WVVITSDEKILRSSQDPGLTPHDPKISQHGSSVPHKGAAGLKLRHNKEQTGGLNEDVEIHPGRSCRRSSTRREQFCSGRRDTGRYSKERLRTVRRQRWPARLLRS